MDQYNNNQQHQFLAHLLSNPAEGGQAYVGELQQLVKSYPQSGILQALLSQAINEREAPAAALYFDPRALHTLLNDPAGLPAVQPAQVYQQQESIPARKKETVAEEEVVAVQEEEVIIPAEENIITESAEETITEQPEAEQLVAEQPVEETTEVFEEITPIEEIAIEPSITKEHDAVSEQIDEEVFEEIVGIDDIATGVKQPEQPEATQFTYEDPYSAEDTRELIEETADTTDNTTEASTEKEPGFKFSYEEEKLIVGNIAATDYFMFDKAFGKIEESAPEPTTTEQQPVQEETETDDAGENKKYVSRYHDEQMPYTFLWWLDKTRREYSGIYRPYSKYTPEQQAVVAEKMAAADALQQQYIENIFHLSSVESLDKNTADNPATEVKHKGDEIIDRFIKEEPQIKPPSSDKLDNENKAKRSSEDSSELVSETLANIYADQMLYHKAIGIYRKLMLKFPEKSRYFADRIESLEKKTS